MFCVLYLMLSTISSLSDIPSFLSSTLLLPYFHSPFSVLYSLFFIRCPCDIFSVSIVCSLSSALFCAHYSMSSNICFLRSSLLPILFCVLYPLFYVFHTLLSALCLLFSFLVLLSCCVVYLLFSVIYFLFSIFYSVLCLPSCCLSTILFYVPYPLLSNLYFVLYPLLCLLSFAT